MKIRCNDILVSFPLVIDRLGRATPGAQTKCNLINYLIVEEIKKRFNFSRIHVEGLSLSLESNDTEIIKNPCEEFLKIRETAVQEVLG